MKRFTAILFTGMMIFTLASCGKKAQDTPTEPATETQAAEKVEMPTETEAVTEVVTEVAKDTQQTETQQTEAQQEEQTAEQPDEEQNNSGENNSSYRYVERASYENGESVSLNPSWQYADHSAINSGCAVMYKATANRKNIVVGVNAGHGTSGGTSVKTLCHPDGSAKTTGGTTGAGATKAVAVSGGMSFNDGTPESSVTLRMAQILKDKLLAAGYDVLMVRDGSDVQLDNVARTVICNNAADCHIALHWDGDGLSYAAFTYQCREA
jgi:N-acetylmuramoyl-L-alanine amidase